METIRIGSTFVVEADDRLNGELSLPSGRLQTAAKLPAGEYLVIGRQFGVEGVLVQRIRDEARYRRAKTFAARVKCLSATIWRVRPRVLESHLEKGAPPCRVD